MQDRPGRADWREALWAILGSAVLTALLTYPLVFNLGRLARIDNDDGKYSIWNVAWVAHALVVDPLHVFDANIFYPRPDTLAYSESNLGAGALAVPGYWLTRSPYVAHNSAWLLGCMLGLLGTYYLVRHLTSSRWPAVVAAICFAFCPYIFAHTPHIQLLMTWPLPFCLLALHRLVERPSASRGAVLGLAMAVQALFCGYYGVFAMLTVGWAVLVFTLTRRLWRTPRFWVGLAIGAVVAIALVAPAFVPYWELRQQTGFARPMLEARFFSADWRAYLASGARAHQWILPFIGHWSEVLFPGFVALVFGIVGLIAVLPRRYELGLVYGGLAILAAWASFGPIGGLYPILYDVVPGFSWLRGPARFGLLVVLALSVLAGLGVAALLRRVRWPNLVGAFVVLLAIGDHAVQLPLVNVNPFPPVYAMLATLPKAPVLEVPLVHSSFFLGADYLLNSTTHWMPLVNGFSDYIPDDYVDLTKALNHFPTQSGLAAARRAGARYVVVHLDKYSPRERAAVLAQLDEYSSAFRPLFKDSSSRLYELLPGN
jgi:hypothetical protein